MYDLSQKVLGFLGNRSEKKLESYGVYSTLPKPTRKKIKKLCIIHGGI